MSDEHGSTRKHPWHCVVIDDLTPEGWPVRCIPHGPLGVYATGPKAYLAGLEHDAAYGGGAWK